MSIEVKNLLKQYGEQKAVNNISFKVEKGEIVGFLGPNGAGKSTTMKIITGYLQQTGGDAFVCGINVAENPLETKKKIGYLPELNALYYDMYVKEYLAFIAEVHKVEDKNSKIEKVIELTGLKIESKKKIGPVVKRVQAKSRISGRPYSWSRGFDIGRAYQWIRSQPDY
jgi:ABC-2 type transport system ATP-binding protein